MYRFCRQIPNYLNGSRNRIHSMLLVTSQIQIFLFYNVGNLFKKERHVDSPLDGKTYGN